MRTVFFGTPAIAVPALQALYETTTVVGVVCQPDRPAGRGLQLHEPPTKQWAERVGVVVHQPLKVKTGNLDEWLIEREVDVAVVMAYGRILPTAVLNAPRHGCINLHASLLPKYRGAAPINWAIMNGETSTGISLMKMDEGMDTGPVFVRRDLPITETTNAGQLTEELAQLAARMVREDLPRAISGELILEPQEASEATSAPPLLKANTQLDFAGKTARELSCWVRGLAPAPTAHTQVRGKGLKVLEAVALVPGQIPMDSRAPLNAGQVRIGRDRRIVVGTAQGFLEILRAQLEGRKPLSATDLVNGRALVDGDQLGF